MKTLYFINPTKDGLTPHAFRTADADCHFLRKPSQALGVLKPILKMTAWMLALTSLTCWNAMANLVSNPGFESGTPSTAYYAGSTSLPAWTVDTTPSDGVQLYFASAFGVTQTPDTQVLQLTGANSYAGGGGVRQTIATTPGVTYTISIDVANRQDGTVTGNFSFGGQNQTLSASSKTFTTLAWNMTATSASTLIDITGSTSSASAQLIIDNVRVTPSPLPLVINSGFESGTPNTAYYAGSIGLTGWTVDTTPSDGVELYSASAFGATQTPDTRVLQLTGANSYAGGGGVQQTIATTSGVTYTISIDVANRQYGTVTGNFSFGGQNQTLSASSKIFTTLAWTVTATSASTLIDITGSTSSGSDQLLIDNVSVTQPALYNVVEQGADPTGTTDCTQLLQVIHSRKQQVYYPNGIYRFNGETLDLSGGIQFQSPNGVVIRNDISPASVVQFDDQGNLIGLQQNHLEQDDADLGPQAQVRSGSLVRPPVSTASPAVAVDLIAHWFNDGGLDARRTSYSWPGWYYWTWNFHQTRNYMTNPDPYDPSRHPLLGFYRGDDPVVLDWQCYWLAQYGVKAVTLCNASPPFDQWDQPSSEAHWAYQLFHNVPNFQKLNYIMWPPSYWIAYTPENQASTEADWVSMIDQIYLQYGNFYSIKSGGKVYPALYVQEGEALRQVFDNSNGSTSTAAFLVRMGNRFKAAGYGGIALLVRHPTGDTVMSYSDLERQGVLYLNAEYQGDYATGSTYPERVATFAPPADRRTIVNTATSLHSHTPHPSQWVCPGSTPGLFKDEVVKAVNHVQANDMLRIVTCYNVAEWAEGGPGLQPNMQDRFGYLQAIKDTVVLPAGTPMQENNVFRPATSLSINYTYATIPNRTDTSWVVPSGYTSVKAMNLGSAINSTFGGVNWLTTNAGTGASYNDAAPISMYYSAPGKAWGTKLTGLYTSQSASLILNDATSSSGLQSAGVDFRLVLGSTGVPSAGFIKGKEYLVQFVFADKRTASKGRKITIEGYSPNIASQNSLPYQFAFGDNRYAVVTARFTPGVGDTEFQFLPLINGGTNGMQLNAIHVLVK